MGLSEQRMVHNYVARTAAYHTTYVADAITSTIHRHHTNAAAADRPTEVCKVKLMGIDARPLIEDR